MSKHFQARLNISASIDLALYVQDEEAADALIKRITDSLHLSSIIPEIGHEIQDVGRSSIDVVVFLSEDAE